MPGNHKAGLQGERSERAVRSDLRGDTSAMCGSAARGAGDLNWPIPRQAAREGQSSGSLMSGMPRCKEGCSARRLPLFIRTEILRTPYKLPSVEGTHPTLNLFLVTVYLAHPWWPGGKESACNAGGARHMSLISGSGRSPGRGHGNPLQYSCLQNPMDRGAWWATIHGVAKSWTQLKWLSTHAHAVYLGIEGIAWKERINPAADASSLCLSLIPHHSCHGSFVSCDGKTTWLLTGHVLIRSSVHLVQLLPLPGTPLLLFFNSPTFPTAHHRY